MFETYADIFNQRGQRYHQAMVDYPLARQAEFAAVLDLLELSPHSILCDAPSGGGYLRNFIAVPGVKLYSVETSAAFAQETAGVGDNTTLLCKTIADLPLMSGSVDRVVSLAGLHHVDPQIDFYREAQRILVPDGIFVVADVQAGSGVDRFLNGFVDQHSTMGHQGLFLGKHTLAELTACGFEIASAQLQSYTWQFPTPVAMARYCQMLFGINQADTPAILDGIQTCVGYEITDTGCQMNWELLCIKAINASGNGQARELRSQ
ncbi:MAG: methyltransferase domain-containing protein [Cyanobacteria bacterium]|nr:methyltransferase domain-containing protein [Cyanobacteriota bacterium]